jgi:serine/threonine protein phosphatase PrpC
MLVESAPDVNTFRLDSRDEFVCVGCDGVWDVLSNQEVVDIIRTHFVGLDISEEQAAAVRPSLTF